MKQLPELLFVSQIRNINAYTIVSQPTIEKSHGTSPNRYVKKHI